jgi:hypothetical protein
MDNAASTRLAGQAGVASVTQLGALGESRHSIDRLVRKGKLIGFRRDAVIEAQVWKGARPWERHALRPAV